MRGLRTKAALPVFTPAVYGIIREQLLPMLYGSKMNLRQLSIAFCLISLPTIAFGTKYAGDFMSMGGGARAMGMGSAFVAVGDDASTVFWNPAGMSGFDKRQALFMHSERFRQLENYNFASFVMPFDYFGGEERGAALGFALIHLGGDDIVVTNGLDYQENNGVPGFQPEEGDVLLYDTAALRRESHNDLALLNSFAFTTAWGKVGGTLKILYTNSIAGFTGFGIGIDLGFLKENLLPNLNVGAKLQDATGTYRSWSTGTNEFISPSLKLGTSYLIESRSLRGSLLLAADGDFYFENRRYASQFWAGSLSADLHLGAELRLQEKVMLRGGLDSGNPTAGAGLRWNFLGLDYAYLHHDKLEATHRVSAFVEF
jgi:hypothetical protein